MVSESVLEGTGMLATERLEWLHSSEAVLSGEKRARATYLTPLSDGRCLIGGHCDTRGLGLTEVIIL